MTHHISSALPGIFYRKPGPDKDPYVEPGDRLEVGQVIGVVEIMKQFSEIRSDVAGVLREFSVEDFGAVNPGDSIAVVDEDGEK
ncbi:biotin carboxyl carrier protein [Psychromicrobium silvestre]|uniref:Biotin carboxyl carrier protein of acetyl-CoA carboxylase n=1 Tax=Psychromicrobium silvestre TaxID=1645614 RepID=A0A7Y9S6P8_9MICC|nr:biotin carboxyl carrier protein [Psychromicrobium silvestre]